MFADSAAVGCGGRREHWTGEQKRDGRHFTERPDGQTAAQTDVEGQVCARVLNSVFNVTSSVNCIEERFF